MVTSRSKSVKSNAPRFIYITGCDGTGKTTQAKLMMQHLAERGVQARHLWLRFPFTLSLPLLAYARWRGYSWYEENSGVRHGYWNFRRSWILRVLLPWVMLFDAMLAALHKIYIPLWLGKTIVCERFVLDMLVDLSVGLEEPLWMRFPGKLFLHLLPRVTQIVVLDLDASTIRNRRYNLALDRNLEPRLAYFRALASDCELPIVVNDQPIPQTLQYIRIMMEVYE